jgi:hypothetical protein
MECCAGPRRSNPERESRLSGSTRGLVRFDRVARCIINPDHSIAAIQHSLLQWGRRKSIDFDRRSVLSRDLARNMHSSLRLVAVFVVLAVSPVAAAEEFEANSSLDELQEQNCAVEEPYSFKLSVSPAGGYNSNVIQLGDGLPLPQGVLRQDAGFFEIGGAATFDWKAAAVDTLVPDQFTASYEYRQDFYEGISGYDGGEHSWSAKYTHLFNERWEYKIEAKDKYNTFDGHSYSNRVSVAPTLEFEAKQYVEKFAKELKTDLVFSFTTRDVFFEPSIPARNLNAKNYGLEVSEVFTPSSYDAAKFKVSFVHFWNDAEGSDYDYGTNRLQLTAETRFSKDRENRWYDLKAIVKYFHDFDCYDHPNSHAGPTGFAFKRHDDKDDFGTTLSFDVCKYADRNSKFAVNAQYHYLRDYSNVAFFNYGQHVIQAGCTLTFDEMKWR